MSNQTPPTEQTLSVEQMFPLRMAALAAAARTHAGESVPEVAHAAGCYLMFLLQGQPIFNIGQTVKETSL